MQNTLKLLKLIILKKLNWAKDLNKHLIKQDIQSAKKHFTRHSRTSVVAQQLRIQLSMQGTQV